MTHEIRRRGLLTAAAALAATPAFAEEAWPNRPVRFVIPFPPGQATDTMVRLLADALSQRWPQRVVVDNRAGGAGVVGTEAGLRSPADGYTVTVSTSGTIGINPSLIPNIPYDAEKDFSYITTVFTVPLVIVAGPNFAPRTTQELIDAARAAPGTIDYGSGGPGTSQHLSAEMFSTRAGIKLSHVPYRGSGPAMADLLSGNIPLMFDSVSSALPQVQGGRIRAIAVTSPQRAPQMPDVPTIAETLPGFSAIGWAGLAVPAATPREIVMRINTDVTAILRDPAMAARMVQLGGSPAPQSPEECTAFVHAEIAKWREAVRSAGVTTG